MRNLIAILILASFTLSSCTKLGKHIKITGKAVSETTGEGIANIPVTIKSGIPNTSFFGEDFTVTDKKNVFTDENGRFTVRIKTLKKSVITVESNGNDDYYASTLIEEHKANEEIIIPVLKWANAKVHIKNVNPYDENDKVYIGISVGMEAHVKWTKIENFGVENAIDLPHWIGTNVNSTVHFKITEDAKEPKIEWIVIKNGVKENGFELFPDYDNNKMNEYTFEY